MSFFKKNQIVTWVIFCAALNINAQKSDDILLKVGSTDVSVSEFRYIYEKNNGANANYSETSINEYLDLYTKFKLKVEKAKQMKLDTIEALKSELDGYRKQLAGSYLIDKEVTEFLLKELYERTKSDIEFSHIFIPVAENESNAAREVVINKLNDIKNKISAGVISFEEAAASYSEDRVTARNNGKMGFFTAKLPSGFYELESTIYRLGIGAISDVVKSKIGYHLIKVTNKRPARGLIEVAHILLEPAAHDKAQTIYEQLKNGSRFEEMLQTHSIDKTHSANGGKLPVFGINTYDASFEDAAFGLQNAGDISAPVQTQSGWHIIKLINKIKPDTYDVFVKKMKSQISKDERFNAAKFQLIEDIKKSSGFKEDNKTLSKFKSTLNDEFYSYKWLPDEQASEANVLFTIGGNMKYTSKDFADFCKANTRTRLKYDNSRPVGETVDELYNEFVNEKILEYEEKNLPVKYPDFKSLMREYEEGILLFEITRMNVWDKANQDTTGLKVFFDNNRNAYFWPEKAAVTIFNVKSVDVTEVDKVHQFASKNDVQSTLKKFNDKTDLVEITEMQCENKSKECSNLEFKKGFVSLPEMTGNGYKFSKIVDIIPPKAKSLNEARGYAVADYQDFLEKEWTKQLSKEFKVSLKQDILKKLKK